MVKIKTLVQVEDTAQLLVERWKPVVEDIKDTWTQKVVANLLENQAKNILLIKQRELSESFETGSEPTTVGKLGTFQKFAFPLVRRVYPQLIANFVVSIQPMDGPVSQVFYLGHDRHSGAIDQTVYSKYNLTYRGLETSTIFSGGNIDADAEASGFHLSTVISAGSGTPSTTFGGQIAAWPDSTTILGVDVSSGEFQDGSGIPEINLHIEQQPVIARTRKMRALWTIEAGQDLKAYHNLDLESELTSLLSQELTLEIDRELIEDLRQIAYDVTGILGGWNRSVLDLGNSNAFPDDGTTNFQPVAFLYDFTTALPSNPQGLRSNVWAIDFGSTALPFAPQHVGHVWANLLGVLNLASQDIWKSTLRGPGNWIITAPLVGALLESAAKLEGGMAAGDRPTNIGPNSIEYKGKLAGKYDLYIDPLYPEDEILMGYKGSGPMDTGFVYSPYIPLQQLPTVIDPTNFQPRKGILTRYGKTAITPEARFYRIIRIIGPTANYTFQPYVKDNALPTGAPS